MKFVTVMSQDKAWSFIKNLGLENNLIFDFNEDMVSILKEKLEDLTGLNTVPVVGVVSDDSNTVKSILDDISSILPVKPGDVVFQFRLPDDQLLYGDFNSVMALLYYPSGDDIEDIFGYNYPSGEKCIAVVNEVKAESFELAYVLNNEWDSDSFGSQSKIYDVQELKGLCESNVFGG